MLKLKTAIPYFFIWLIGMAVLFYFDFNLTFFLRSSENFYQAHYRGKFDYLKKSFPSWVYDKESEFLKNYLKSERIEVFFQGKKSIRGNKSISPNFSTNEFFINSRLGQYVVRYSYPQDKITQRVFFLYRIVFYFTLILFNFIVIWGWWKSYSFAESVVKINQTLDKFLRGDFSVRFKVKKGDPFAFFLSSFNYLIDKLRHQIEEIAEKNRRLKLVNEEKSKLLEEIKKFNEELNKKVKEAVRKYQLINEQLEGKIIELKNMRILNENIFSSLPGGLLTIDKSGKIIFYNREVERIFNLKDNFIGDSVYKVFPKEFTQFFRRMLERNIKIMRDICIEIKENNKFIGMNLSLLKNYRDEVEGCVAIFNDITQNIVLREQVNRSKVLSSLGQIAAGVAHEIRNPLGAIKGFVELMEDDLIGTRNEKYVQKILKEIDGINNIVSAILNYSRFKMPSFEDDVEINQILKDSLEILKLKGKKFNLIVEGMDKKIYHKVDPLQLKQVFNNLLSNSLEAIEDGIGEIRVELLETEDYILIEISDNGCGIAEADLDKIFIPFYTTKQFGTGLGMAIVDRIIENHNGFIKIKSQVGKGTDIKIYLRKRVML